MSLIMTKDGWKLLEPEHCTPAPHDKSLLEIEGIHPDQAAVIDQCCRAIRRYLGTSNEPRIDVKQLFYVLEQRKPVQF